MNVFVEALKLIFKFDKEIYGIIGLSLIVSIASVVLAGFLSIPTGVAIGSAQFKGKKMLVRIINTLMGLPPVLVGLIVYMLLSNKGALGSLQLLFTPYAMVIAQVIIIFPIITGLTITAIAHIKQSVWDTCTGLGLSKTKTILLLINECQHPIVSAFLAGYGRAVSEVGAVMIVGGNIQYHTRVMTTAIVLETGKGNYEKALAIGLVLLILAFFVNWLLHRLSEEVHV